MNIFHKAAIAGATGLLALGLSVASAKDYRSDDCVYDQNRRGNAEYCNERDRSDQYYRGDRDQKSRAQFSVQISSGDYYSKRPARYYDRDNRVLRRLSFDTRHRARIVLTEEIRYNRRGRARLVCTVRARGPERDYVSIRRMNRIADRECSRRARIRVLA